MNKNSFDKYYTNKDAVEYSLNLIKQYLAIQKEELIIEPSAGNGAFIEGIKKISNNYKFYDISPENPEIIQQDYLLLNYENLHTYNLNGKSLAEIKNIYGYNLPINCFEKYRIHIIGNPPFGKKSSLAFKFIKTSCEFADTISFILPKTFKKDSFIKRIPKNFHIVLSSDLPKNSFEFNGEPYDVPCMLLILKKEIYDRDDKPTLKPINFKFVNKTDKPHFSIRRVGSASGQICIKSDNKNPNTHHFVQLNDYNDFEKLIGITYDFDNTVGAKSLSKQEIILKYNKILTNMTE